MKVLRWINKVLELCYPPQCFFCSASLKGRESLCGECEGGLARVDEPFCEVCGEPFEGVIEHAFSCYNCHGVELAFDFAVAAVRSSNEATELVHHLKYKRELHLSVSMAEVMAQCFFKEPRLAGKQWKLLPVPLHWSRKAKRGFNQAAELAKHLSVISGQPQRSFLVRKKAVSSQARLGRAKRLKNLQGSFAVRESRKSDKSSPILIIDDVLTTGSTASECAKVLRKAGYKGEIAVLTFMRG